MNGRHRNATNAQIWEMKNDLNYDGNCTARHCLSGTYEISRRWIFVRLSVQYLFIDFQEAYDSVYGDTQWEYMKEFKIPTKLINMCKTCTKDKKCG